MQRLASPPPQSVVAPKKNRIQVSNTKKPLFFYVNLAKRYINQYNEVELSSLGMAVTMIITIAKDLLKHMNLSLFLDLIFYDSWNVWRNGNWWKFLPI
ncbi:hypothetical protein C1H46_029845 [Malus baccata]|uniref:DNA/RNA-binding protein Alba-like domain-containing protein n=1 Tax=Malus baccata TaxID=106549 RepID=A0A540LDS1_MALBA|nr:hypothetical protein C1H46_029845 [Malus baccata]